VDDIEGCAQFYIDLFGFQTLDRKYNDTGELRALWLRCGEIIFMFEKGEPETESHGVIAFSIQRKDRETWRKKLNHMSVPITRESQFSIYFPDPEGRALALSHSPEVLEWEEER